MMGSDPRRRRRAVALAVVMLAVSVWGPTSIATGGACADGLPSDPGFYERMVRERDDGWLGADVAGHVDLGPNRVLWLFGDSVWGQRRPDGSFGGRWSFVTNSAASQSGHCVTMYRPFEDFASPGQGADLYWPNDGWVAGDDLHVVFTRIQATGAGGMFGFRSAGHDVVRFDRHTLEVESRTALPALPWNLGSSVERAGDTLFWYGRSFTGDTGSHFLARSPVARPLAFEYRTADGWSGDAARAVPVHRRPQVSNARFHRLPDGRWAAVYKDHEIFGTGIVADVAENPWGPFAHMGRIATAAPRTRGAGELTYSGSMHPGIGWSEGRVLLHWSHNSLRPGRVSDGTVGYRPSFTSVPVSVLANPAGLGALHARQIYVDAAYQELAGRPPAAARDDYWSNELGFGLGRDRFAATLARSTSAIGTAVDRLHSRLLIRPADPLSRDRWVDAVRRGGRISDVAAELLGSEEFFVRALADRGRFVALLYETVLGRAASGAEVRGWVQAMDRGASRAAVAASVLGSTEARLARVDDVYRQVLGRPADRAGLARGAAVLARGDELTLAGELVGSAEFFARAQAAVRRG